MHGDDDVRALLDEHRSNMVEDLVEWVRIPSIAGDPELPAGEALGRWRPRRLGDLSGVRTPRGRSTTPVGRPGGALRHPFARARR